MFPYVAAYSETSNDTSNCGKCMKITYNDKMIYVTVVDARGPPTSPSEANVSFNFSQDAF